MTILKGFRTYAAALIIAVEPLLEVALSNTSVDLALIGRQVLIAAIVVALRTITTTPPGSAGNA